MDGRRFDQIARSLSAAKSRRGLIQILTTVPLIGALLVLLGDREAGADGSGAGIGGNRRKHKNRVAHRHRRNKDDREPKPEKCKAKSKAKTCAGKCGPVKNNCKKKVDCGPCDCNPPCPVCQICDEEIGQCEPNAETVGDDCGEPGQVCQIDGTCSCEATSCDVCETCQGDGLCSAPTCGGTGCCDGDGCQPGTGDDACGTGGDACVACEEPDTCGGGGQSGVCGCTPITECPPQFNCGSIFDGCGGLVFCGDSPCSNPTPACVNNICSSCFAAGQCVSGCCAGDGTCQPGNTNQNCGPDGSICVECFFNPGCQNRQCPNG